MSDIYKEKREQIRKQIITTKEIQKWLNITRQRVSDFVREGRLTPICRGIFLRDEVEDFIRKRQRNWGGD